MARMRALGTDRITSRVHIVLRSAATAEEASSAWCWDLLPRRFFGWQPAQS